MAEAVETTPTLTVLYATETGNAEDLAVRIAHLAYRYHVSARVCNMADYDKAGNYILLTCAASPCRRDMCRVCRLDDWQW